MYNDLYSYIVFGQIPHPVVSVTKEGSMELLIKLLLLLLLLEIWSFTSIMDRDTGSEVLGQGIS